MAKSVIASSNKIRRLASRHPRRLVLKKTTTLPISIFGNVLKQIDQAAKLLDLDKSLINFIKMPRRSTICNLRAVRPREASVIIPM